MSAAEVLIGGCASAVVELAALQGRMQGVAERCAARGVTLPACGRAVYGGGTLALCVRPARWLLLSAPAAPGVCAQAWREACAGAAAVIDHSSGLDGICLQGPQARTVLARGCRLDLDPQCFPAGHAAATPMAQVATILAALPAGLLILTPASTARHFREWLAAAARPFGLAALADVTVCALAGDPPS